MKKEMLINAIQPEECRIAILENGVLEELYVERTSHESYVGNIYKGRIVNIEPSIQAAFVDFGVGRNGFLHVSDVESAYYRHLLKHDDRDRDRGDRGGRRRRGRRSNPAVSRNDPNRRDASRDADDPANLQATLTSGDELSEEDIHNYFEDDATETFDLPEDQAAQDESATEVEEDEESEEEEAFPGLDINLDPENLRADAAGPLFSPTSILPPVFGDPAYISIVNEPAEQEAAAEEKTDGDHEETAESIEISSDDDDAHDEVMTDSDEEINHESEEEPEPESVPEPMPSAEYRTSEPSEEEANEGEEQAANETDEANGDFSDEDLSFSIGRPEPEPEPAFESADETMETTIEPMDLPSDDASPESEEEAVEITNEADGGKAERSRPVIRADMSEFEDESQYMSRRPSRGRQQRHNRRARRPGGRPKPLIQDIFKKGQEVIVQVIKEGIGTKGPTLSTYISIAGRYLVLMPGLNRIGVSRKITDEEQRRRLKDILHDLKPPKGLGFIIRTAGFDRTKKELQRDLSYLSRLWQVVARRIQKCKGPSEIYQESDMITRTIRDTFTSDIQTIWVDDESSFDHAKEFLQIVMPRHANRIKWYQGPEPIFHRYNLEQEIGQIHEKNVPLPGGGSIVIEQTEALVAIDVNSGNFRADNNAEETAYQMNLIAAKEIARQLRLRDMGGVIVNDFIDMREEKHRRGVERAMRDAVKRDRARTKILRISAFGIIEMTRQRIRPSLKRSVYEDCGHCRGGGLVKTCESVSIDVMRLLQLAAARSNVTNIVVKVSEAVERYLLNRKRRELVQLEEETDTRFDISHVHCAPPEQLSFICYDNNGNEVPYVNQPRGGGRDSSRHHHRGRGR